MVTKYVHVPGYLNFEEYRWSSEQFFLNYTKNTKQKNASIQNTYVMPLAAIL